MSRRIGAWLISAVMLLALAGCQLAVEGKGTASNPDMLRGVFITFGSSCAADTTTLLDDDDIEQWVNGGTIQMDNGGAGQRIIATTREDEYGGMKYVFDGIDGIPMFSALIPGNGEDNDYWASCYDNALLDVKTTVGGMGSGSSVQIDGTLTLNMNADHYDEYGQCVLFLNPVYQNADREVYMLPAGSGVGLGVVNADDDTVSITSGNLGKYTISESAAMKSGDKEESWSGEYSLTVMGAGDIKRCVLKEMDASDQLIKSTQITQDNIPDAFTLNDNTIYALLEEYSADDSGKIQVDRSLVDMSAEFFAVRFPDKKGFIKKTLINLNNRPD